ncbi:MAG: RHS repeat protein [Caldilineaceae bacterium]|nr:RHS repeat protein [Caldilineaceae bacterium]
MARIIWNLQYVRTYNPSGGSWVQDAQVTLTHDALGNLTSVSHPNSIGTTTLTYDMGGRKTEMSDPTLGTWSYKYDRQGKLTRQTDARGATICLYYDNIGRLVGKHFRWDTSCPTSGASYNVNYAYDQEHSATNRSRGQLTNVGNGGYGKHLTYNDRGLLTREEVWISGIPQNANTYYGYDGYLRPTTVTYPDGDVVTTSYNGMGLPNALYTNGPGNQQDGYLVQNVDYDAAGRLVTMQFPLGGNLWQAYTYYPWSKTTADSRSSSDSNGRLQQIALGTQAGGRDRYRATYAYDSHGNVSAWTEQINNSTVTSAAFSYDAQNRLLTGFGRSYGYDSGGRLTSYEGTAQRVHPTQPQATAPNWSQYAVDVNGNFTARVQNGVAQTLVWDHENRLSSVTGGGVNDSFLYDADGQRVKKTSNGTTTYYPNQYYEQTGGTNVDKYYYFNAPRGTRPLPCAATAGWPICTRTGCPLGAVIWRW